MAPGASRTGQDQAHRSRLAAAGRVSEAMHELGWESSWIGKQNREDLTVPIANLRESAMQLGLAPQVQGEPGPGP